MKAGRIPIALGLIAYGAALALDNLGVTSAATDTVLRFWPLLLIGAGLEYLWASRDETRRAAGFDVGGAILLLVIVLVTTGLRWFPFQFGFMPNFSRTILTTAPSEGVRELHISTGVGRIQLEPGLDQIEVEATVSAQFESDLEGVEVKISSGPVARVYLEGVKSGRAVTTSYLVRAPQGLKVKAESGTGSVTVRGYHGDMSLHSNTGRTEVDTGSGSLTVSGGTGSITVSDFEGPVSLRTNTGSVHTHRTAGDLQITGGTSSVTILGFRGGNTEVRTSTGSITAETYVPLEGDVRLRASTGSVTLRVPENSSMRVTARTNTGGMSGPSFVAVEKSGASRSGSGTLGDGRYLVDLQTGTGSITIRH